MMAGRAAALSERGPRGSEVCPEHLPRRLWDHRLWEVLLSGGAIPQQ